MKKGESMGIKVACSDLKKLLTLTQRRQTVAGKNNPQVLACVLRCQGLQKWLRTDSLVRDGRTSVSSFWVGAAIEPADTGPESIVVPDIEQMLGVLKAHKGEITLTSQDNKTIIKSAKKKTTLQAQSGGLAFPHSQETIGEWERKSADLLQRFSPDEYKMADGTRIEAFYTVSLPASELAEAFSCDNINGQKLNQYEFIGAKETSLSVRTGGIYKGQTEYTFEGEAPLDEFTVVFEGGLENVMSQLNCDVKVSFLDFRPYKQGIRAIFSWDDPDLLEGGIFMQAGVIND
tara:strand:- start:23900 stop:24766 length:867 start_codon:yes stop_codon:yes gene_type:complete